MERNMHRFMAKEDYQAAGAKHCRDPLNNQTSYRKGIETSWQAKAFWAGFAKQSKVQKHPDLKKAPPVMALVSSAASSARSARLAAAASAEIQQQRDDLLAMLAALQHAQPKDAS